MVVRYGDNYRLENIMVCCCVATRERKGINCHGQIHAASVRCPCTQDLDHQDPSSTGNGPVGMRMYPIVRLGCICHQMTCVCGCIKWGCLDTWDRGQEQLGVSTNKGLRSQESLLPGIDYINVYRYFHVSIKVQDFLSGVICPDFFSFKTCFCSFSSSPDR